MEKCKEMNTGQKDENEDMQGERKRSEERGKNKYSKRKERNQD